VKRYTTKHFWRMEESEQGEWIMYSDYEKKSRDGWQKHVKHIGDLYISEMKRNIKLERENDHYTNRMLVLYYVLMATYGAIVGKLIGWSFGL